MFLLRRKAMPAVGCLTNSGCVDQASGSGEGRSLTIGYMNRDEDVAVANVSKILLEEELDFALTEEQFGELELEIRGAGYPEKGTRARPEENRDVGEAWLPKN